jgi:hypothetical protein
VATNSRKMVLLRIEKVPLEAVFRFAAEAARKMFSKFIENSYNHNRTQVLFQLFGDRYL